MRRNTRRLVEPKKIADVFRTQKETTVANRISALLGRACIQDVQLMEALADKWEAIEEDDPALLMAMALILEPVLAAA